MSTNQQTVAIVVPTGSAPEGHDERMTAIAEGKIPPGGELPKPVATPATGDETIEALEARLAAMKAAAAPAPAEVPQVVEKTPVDMATYTKEFAEKGALSAESYTKLAAEGFPKELVDGYIEGQMAKASAYELEVKGSVGGPEKFAQIAAWAGENLSESELAAYHAAVSSGDKAQAKLALTAVAAKYTAANGQRPQLINGKVTQQEGDVFKSWEQVRKAMSDPQYRKDHAYRTGVEQKLARSKL